MKPTCSWQAILIGAVLVVAIGSVLVVGVAFPISCQQELGSFTEAKEAVPVPDAGLNIEMKLIPAGEFQMGSPESDDDADNHEKPQHKVRITKPFYLGVTEVTQEQYERVMGKNPSYFRGDPQRPVEKVSWGDAVEFCRQLSEKEGRTYRLPTEAEWEYACRAGTNTKWCFGDNDSALGGHANYKDNAVSTTHAVARKKPNAWGLYDMHGNVWEWCADYCDRDYYAGSLQDDPQGPASGPCRVYRGGSWLNGAGNCRSAVRCGHGPVKCGIILGFRVARSPSDE